MKTLARNMRPFLYCLYQGKEMLTDEYGNETGEYKILFSDPVEVYGNISPATGYSQTEQFGNLENYDKVIVMDNPDTPINDNSVLFIDKDYEADTDGTPLFDYTVRRVARSINSVSIAVSKVTVR